MAYTFILTCEHAGNEIPDEYQHLFKGKEKALYSHKAMDFGALQLAKFKLLISEAYRSKTNDYEINL